MGDCGVTEASAVEFVLEATAEARSAASPRSSQSRDLTCDELGLLYCYKHGVSTNQALKTIGIDMKLADFVKEQKAFVVEGKKVSLVRSDTALKPMSVAQQLEGILREQGPTMDITTLCSKFIQKFHVSVASIVQMRPVEFIQQEKEKFAMIGDGLVTLKECEAREAAKVSASTASASRVARSRSPGFVRSASPQQQRARSTERVRPRTVALSQQKAENEEMYQELHTKISSRSFNSRVAQALSTIKETVESKLFLNIAEVAKGGSVGKGTAIAECEDAELVFFVKGLPTEGHKKWLPPLLKSVESVLTENLDAEMAASVECTETSVQVSMKNQVTE